MDDEQERPQSGWSLTTRRAPSKWNTENQKQARREAGEQGAGCCPSCRAKSNAKDCGLHLQNKGKPLLVNKGHTELHIAIISSANMKRNCSQGQGWVGKEREQEPQWSRGDGVYGHVYKN